VHSVDQSAQSAGKTFAFICQLPGWAVVAPLWLPGEPGTVQNWLFSCWHCCMHSTKFSH